MNTLARLVINASTLSPKSIQVQRRLLLQRAQQHEGLQEMRFDRLIREQVFRVHPYGRTVSNRMFERDHLTAQVLSGFVKRFFCPSNLIVVVAGPTSTKEMILGVARAFSSWTPLEDSRTTRLIEPKIVKSRHFHLLDKVIQPRVALAFVAPPAKSDESLAGILLARMMSPFAGGHLRKQIFGFLPSDAEIRTSYYPHRDPSPFVINVRAHGADPSKVSTMVLQRLNKLAQTSFSLSELAKEKAKYVAQFLSKHQTLFEQSYALGRMACIYGPERMKNFLRRLLSLSSEALLSFIRETLCPESCCVVSIAPSKHSNLSRLQTPEVLLKFPSFRTITGVPFSHAHIYELGNSGDLTFRVTARVPEKMQSTVSNLAASLGSFLETKLSERAFDGGWWIDVPSDSDLNFDLVEIQLSCEASVVSEIAPLFLRLLFEAGDSTALPVPLKRSRVSTPGLPVIARRGVLKIIEVLSLKGNSVQAVPVTGEALARTWKKLLHLSQLSLVICGRCEQSVITQVMQRAFPQRSISTSSMTSSTSSTFIATRSAPLILHRAPETRPRLVLPPAALPGSVQKRGSSHRNFKRIVNSAGPHGLVVGVGALRYLQRHDSTIALLLAEILGQGENSRIVRRIRDGMGLGYSSGAIYLPITGKSLLVSWISVHPERIVVSEQAIVEEFLRLSNEPVSPSELVQARATLRTRIAACLQSSLRAAPFLGRLLARSGESSPMSFLKSTLTLTTQELLDKARASMIRHIIYIERPAVKSKASVN